MDRSERRWTIVGLDEETREAVVAYAGLYGYTIAGVLETELESLKRHVARLREHQNLVSEAEAG